VMQAESRRGDMCSGCMIIRTLSTVTCLAWNRASKRPLARMRKWSWSRASWSMQENCFNLQTDELSSDREGRSCYLYMKGGKVDQHTPRHNPHMQGWGDFLFSAIRAFWRGRSDPSVPREPVATNCPAEQLPAFRPLGGEPRGVPFKHPGPYRAWTS
jgi:hypothetical protein